MPRRSGPSGPPKSFTVKVGSWPAGPFREDAPAAVAFMAHVAASLRRELDARELPVADVADAIGVQRTTIYDVLNGETYVDTHTLALLEQYLKVSLWPTNEDLANPGSA